MEVEEEVDFVFDEYEHLDSELFYSFTRIPGKDAPESLFQDFECGCNCLDFNCTVENNCSCVKYGENYRLIGKGLVLNDDKFLNHPIFECNSKCSCANGLKKDLNNSKLCISKIREACPNRNVQFGPIQNLEIFNAGVKGLGLKTNDKILRGSFICEYAGEVIGLEEAKKRQKNRSLRQEMNFIFILKEYVRDNLYNVTCVDPTQIGNIGRYINHSCQPNSAIVPVRVNNNVPWLCVFAIRDIEKHEEITYDYSGSNMYSRPSGSSVNLKPCYCGADTCKQFLPFEVEV